MIRKRQDDGDEDVLVQDDLTVMNLGCFCRGTAGNITWSLHFVVSCVMDFSFSFIYLFIFFMLHC